MSQSELIALVLFILAIIGAVTGAWWRVEMRVKEAKQEASLRADAAGTKADLVTAQLAEYKTHVAETYVSKQGLREMREEVSVGLKDIKSSISGIHDRIDRMFERSKE